MVRVPGGAISAHSLSRILSSLSAPVSSWIASGLPNNSPSVTNSASGPTSLSGAIAPVAGWRAPLGSSMTRRSPRLTRSAIRESISAPITIAKGWAEAARTPARSNTAIDPPVRVNAPIRSDSIAAKVPATRTPSIAVPETAGPGMTARPSSRAAAASIAERVKPVSISAGRRRPSSSTSTTRRCPWSAATSGSGATCAGSKRTV